MSTPTGPGTAEWTAWLSAGITMFVAVNEFRQRRTRQNAVNLTAAILGWVSTCAVIYNQMGGQAGTLQAAAQGLQNETQGYPS